MSETIEEALAHHGVKGMRWGVRRDRSDSSSTAPNVRAAGVKVGSDGSIEIQKGASLQRLVRSNGKSLPMKDITYASMLEHDNSKYIKYIGGKGPLSGGRDRVLSLTATEKISAPSVHEATKLTSDLFLKNEKFRTTVKDPWTGRTVTDKDMSKIRADPTGSTAKAWYNEVNRSLTYDPKFYPQGPYVQKVFSEKLGQAGHNAVRDENDFGAGVAKAPIIIFHPETSLKVTRVSDITDDLRKASKAKLKQYKSLGKDWVDRELYSS